ncbi:MAG: recombinase family protein [Acidobacteria bacterium]|nr:recombinase family protein [Acidobacteriota bacterium]
MVENKLLKKVARPERFELPTFWFVASSGVLSHSCSALISAYQFFRLTKLVRGPDPCCETLSHYSFHYGVLLARVRRSLELRERHEKDLSTAHGSRGVTARCGCQVAGKYVDMGISGAKEKRPELNRLMTDAHGRRFEIVAVWKFDRFARSVSHVLRALETFRALGIEFVSLSEQVDTSTPTGKMVFTVLGAVAELERALIVERVKAGMRNARAKGRCIGRPPRTYLAPETRTAIATAYVAGEVSLRDLAARFGTSIGTVQSCLTAYQRASARTSASA